MINNDSYMGYKALVGYKTPNKTNNTAQVLAKQVASANKWKMEKLEGDVDPNSFASKLKRAGEYAASGESCGATDSIGIILRQMDEPTVGNPVTKDVWHNGAHVSITKDLLQGTTITIGGSANPDWIYVSTSVGTVKIDLNDTTSLMKCLDMFSPEDINAILKKIQEVKQAREAMREIERMEDRLFQDDRAEKEDGGNDGEMSIDEAVGVVSAEEQNEKRTTITGAAMSEMKGVFDTEGKPEKKFVG